MADERTDAIAAFLVGSSGERRALLRTLGSGLFAIGAGAAGADARMKRRPRKARRLRRHDVKAIKLDQDPVACDPTATSGIAGLVLIGPLCPVVTQDNPCPDQPYAATIVVRDAQGNEVCATQSGDDGRFRVGLPPGTYVLDPLNGQYGLPFAGEQSVTVEPGQYTEVLVSYDSGIR